VTIVGVGIDVADVSRLARLISARGERFVGRWFTRDEIRQCQAGDRPNCEFAARFAAKEAIWKALGVTWDGPVPWRSIAVLKDEARPSLRVQLSGQVGEAVALTGTSRIFVTTSCRNGRATAVAIAQS
jgi:holo-[acyl-carrier protein] synthase